jgi:phage gp36-like protein
MAICTIANLFAAFDEDRCKQLASDLSGGIGKPVYNEDNLLGILADAEGLILLALSRQYTSVQIAADAGVKRICLDIAMYLLEKRKGNPAEAIENGYLRAWAIIESLQNGTAKLAGVAQLLPTIAIDNDSASLEITSSGMFDGVVDSDYYDGD